MEPIIFIFMLLIFTTGAVCGSFLNVCIYRIPNKESIAFPPSHCPQCRHRLHIRDLVPIVSYLSLRGKCRYCDTSISKQYPFIELLCGVLFVLIFIFFEDININTAIMFLITLFLIPIAVIDIKHYIIPNKILLALMPIACAIAGFHMFVQPVFLYRSPNMLDPIYGALIGSGILFSFSFIGYFLYRKKEVMGMGDVKLFFVLGLLIGFSNTLLMLLISVIMAAFGSIVMMAFFHKTSKDMLAFGPYIVLAFYITVFIQTPLAKAIMELL